MTRKSTEEKYYGADTQAAHKVGGLKGSASFARRICQSCMATTDDIQYLFSEQLFEVHSPEKHE